MIEIQQLTKSYKTGTRRNYLFRNMNAVFPSGKNIGILGRNGAGKSTLLRIMGGIDYPDSGRIVSNKTISWPMGLSGGFQGSMTGRENAAFIAQVHGFWGKQRKRLLEEVDDFAGLEDYFDMPVKTYSSGMRSKLAFGLSIAVHFDYYLVDEVMSVGDAHFREKCENVIAEKKRISNFIIVAHSMATLRKNCDIGVYLSRDGIEVHEDINAAIKIYEDTGKKASNKIKKLPL
jgi:capsular polysaccharide transport system ATP-binding protein